ncbi:MAG: thiamine-phosphate kinase [Erythrobacter sp.]|jgi:thiamine-monophosphate kinase|uniref:thiamine-phosphate kinase n=1 Tax=Erythrobacter sp. TaxID=1042 RepID=UPI002B493171|nr:thiamine-phosphate kinase [Erythrobacter sp.]WRH70486.1 MAG: thiamine-phosphate kinase [Erythrobacter sp.]
MNETEFVAALRKLPLHPGARGLEDDCAVLAIGSETLVITHDMMAEDTHFRSNADMADVAWKLLAANLSDLAAKGAEPVGVLLGHSLGMDDARFLAGLEQGLTAYDVPLMGGDTVATTGTSTYGMTAIGRAVHVPVPSRKGAGVSDAIYITGPVGRAMLGYEGDPDHLEAFNRPVPRLAEGMALAPLVSAMMDISDGLLLDCWRMGWVSGVTLAIESALVPVADRDRLDECVRWGDDYELLFTAPAGTALPVPAHRIGTVRARGHAPLLLDEAPLADPVRLGYRHG